MDSLETGQNRHRRLRNGLTDSLIGPHRAPKEAGRTLKDSLKQDSRPPGKASLTP